MDTPHCVTRGGGELSSSGEVHVNALFRSQRHQPPGLYRRARDQPHAPRLGQRRQHEEPFQPREPFAETRARPPATCLWTTLPPDVIIATMSSCRLRQCPLVHPGECL